MGIPFLKFLKLSLIFTVLARVLPAYRGRSGTRLQAMFTIMFIYLFIFLFLCETHRRPVGHPAPGSDLHVHRVHGALPPVELVRVRRAAEGEGVKVEAEEAHV